MAVNLLCTRWKNAGAGNDMDSGCGNTLCWLQPEKSERLTFVAGTYEVTAQGHNGDIRLSVTFSDSCITDIQVLEQHETPHIGDIVFDELIPRIIAANGTGVDAMTGATVTSRGLMAGMMEAANKAKVSDEKQFKAASLPKADSRP